MIFLRRLILSAAACALTLGVSPASSNNGIEFYELDMNESYYVDCLGEYVDIQQHVTAAFHMFTTPSGNLHIVDNWKISVLWTGMSTGRMWFGQLTSPFQINLGPGYVEQWSLKGVQKPVTEGAPKFFWTASFKATVNANGELIVLNDASTNSIRCLGNN